MLNEYIAVVTCLHCKFWDRPKNWEDFKNYKSDEPYDWSDYSSDCSKLPDVDCVEVELDIHGNASVDVEISTVGTFGCPLGELRDEKPTVPMFKVFLVCKGDKLCGPYKTADDAFNRAEVLINERTHIHFEVEYLENNRFLIGGKVVCGQFEYVNVASQDVIAEESENNFLDAVQMIMKGSK